MKNNAKKERDLTSRKTRFFFFFLSIKSKLTKYAKRNSRIHDSFPPSHEGEIFFQNANHFSLKSKLKVSQERGNQDQDIFCDLEVFKDLT
jgi:hypothetical protein